MDFVSHSMYKVSLFFNLEPASNACNVIMSTDLDVVEHPSIASRDW